MDLLIPEFGTIFWTLIVFSHDVFISWPNLPGNPCLKALKERDNSIAQALQAAEKAKKEVSQLHLESEKLMAEAKANVTRFFRKPVNSRKP